MCARYGTVRFFANINVKYIFQKCYYYHAGPVKANIGVEMSSTEAAG
jgi:hypothetical protein